MPREIPVAFKPSGFYFRRALRSTNDATALREIGMTLVLEVEYLRQWMRDQGMVPPKCHVMRSEAADKGWIIEA